MKKDIPKLYPGQHFQVDYRAFMQERHQWNGSFVDVAEAALLFVQSIRPVSPILRPKWQIFHQENTNGTLEPMRPPINRNDVLLAIEDYSSGTGAQLWLLIATRLIREHQSLDIPGIKAHIEKSRR